MIEFHDVRKVFQSVSTGAARKQTTGSATPVFEKFNLSIARNEFVGVLGPSGCGKSTLLKMIAGLESVDGGHIQFVVPPRFGFVFQEPNLLPWLTVQENALLPFRINGLAPDLHALKYWLQQLNLQNAWNRFPHELSGGMKMRTSFLRALMMKPDVLLLDEPFAALDEVIRVELQKQLFDLSLANEMTVLFVTHSISEATKLCSRILLLDYGGQIILDEAQARTQFHFQLSESQKQLSTRLLGSFPQVHENRFQSSFAVRRWL